MKRFLPLLCLAIAFLVISPDSAWSQDGSDATPTPSVTRPGRGGGRNRTDPNANGKKTPAPSPSATPTPTPPPPPAVIYGLSTGMITVIQGEPAATASYKVTRDSTITINGQAATFAALKTGMRVVITPTSDMTYANIIEAADAPPAPLATPAEAVSGSAAPAVTPSGTAAGGAQPTMVVLPSAPPTVTPSP